MKPDALAPIEVKTFYAGVQHKSLKRIAGIAPNSFNLGQQKYFIF